MSRDRRPHGRAPRMSAALRRAFETWDGPDGRDMGPGDKLCAVGISASDAEQVVDALYEHYGKLVGDERRDQHPLAKSMSSVQRAGEDGADPDALPLMEALIALPAGQRATLLAMIDMTCALATAEGMALGALYLSNDWNGRDSRARTRPRR